MGVGPRDNIGSMVNWRERISVDPGYAAELARNGSVDLPAETSAHPRITVEPNKRGSKLGIRRMRITVGDVLG